MKDIRNRKKKAYFQFLNEIYFVSFGVYHILLRCVHTCVTWRSYRLTYVTGIPCMVRTCHTSLSQRSIAKPAPISDIDA